MSAGPVTSAEQAGALRARALRLPEPRLLLGSAGLGAIVVVTTLVVAAAAAGPSFLVPSSHGGFPDWLAGPLKGLGTRWHYDDFGVAALALLGAYLLVLWSWRALPVRLVVGTIVACHLVLLLAPPLLSADALGYLSYGRLGVHGIDPYLHGAASATPDVLRPYVLWHDAPSPYGPLFTLATYALVPLGPGASLWALKLAVVASSLGCVALTWSIAARLDREPVRAAALVGLNPVLLLFAVGGAHNDLLMTLLVLAGIAWLLSGRGARAGAAVVLGAAIKASGGLVLPFMLAGSRPEQRRLMGAGAVIAAALVAAATLAGFGTHALRMVHQLAGQQSRVAFHSVPEQLARVFGLSAQHPVVHVLALTVLAAGVSWALLSALRGKDWITCAGWAVLVVLVTTSWLLPWYLVWLLPLAALSSDRRLVFAVLALSGYLLATRIPFLLA